MNIYSISYEAQCKKAQPLRTSGGFSQRPVTFHSGNAMKYFTILVAFPIVPVLCLILKCGMNVQHRRLNKALLARTSSTVVQIFSLLMSYLRQLRNAHHVTSPARLCAAIKKQQTERYEDTSVDIFVQLPYKQTALTDKPLTAFY